MMMQNRIAVSIYFLINGILYASWAARLPELQQMFGVSHTGLGTLLFTSAIGAVLAMPFTGLLTKRLGNDWLTRYAGWAFCILPACLPFADSPLIAGIIFFGMGVASGSLDVSMNGQAVLVERAWGKVIMSSFHAVFSVGMAMGAGLGALMTRWEVDIRLHFVALAAACFVACVWAAFHLTPTPKQQKELDETSEGPLFVLPTQAILPLGIIAFCAMTGEGAMADWSAIFMNEVVGEPKSMGAIAVGAFSVAMTLGRIFGDYAAEQLGRSRLLWYSSLLAVIGLGLIVGIASTWSSLIGFFAVGLGLANVVPIVYSAAGNTPGVEPSVGIAMATTIGYSGFFVGPPFIGFLGDQVGLRIGLLFPLILCLIMWGIISRQKLS